MKISGSHTETSICTNSAAAIKQKVLYLLSNPNPNVLLDVSYTKLKVNLKNMNIGDAISRNLDNISELTLYVSW